MLKGYDNILVLSGAGFGIDSGLPDYKELHTIIDNARLELNIDPNFIENPSFYKTLPDLAWGIQAKLMNIFLTKSPHKGYYKLKEILKDKNYFVVTSNIDDHYRDAEFDENKLYEIHGRLKILQCVNRNCNNKHNLWKLDHLPQEKNYEIKTPIPKCKYCNDYARPNVCFTNDYSFCNKIRDTQKAKFNSWIKNVSTKRNTKLLVLEIGCGRHKDSIGMNRQLDGSFKILSNELKFPSIFNETNMKIIRINPDKTIKKENWEEVYYETGLNFFTRLS